MKKIKYIYLSIIFIIFCAKMGVKAKSAEIPDIYLDGITILDRPYDGTTNVELDTTQSILRYVKDDIEVVDSQVVLESVTGSILSKDVGNKKEVLLEAKISGDNASLYNLDINFKKYFISVTPVEVEVQDLNIKSKVYDGSIDVEVNGTLEGIVAGDTVELSGKLKDKNAGKDKPVDLSLIGEDSGNYQLINNTTMVDISPKQIQASEVNVKDRDYDGSVDVEVNGTLEGIVAGDEVELSGKLKDKNAGKDKPVDLALIGEDSGNYYFYLVTSVTIYPKIIECIELNATPREYNEETSVEVLGILEGVLLNEEVLLSVDASLTDKNAGSNKFVFCKLELLGNDSNNYILLENIKICTVDIYKKNINIDNVYTVSREYDSTCDIELKGGKLLLETKDDLNFILNFGTIIDANVGDEKLVSTNIELIGKDSINYNLIQPNNLKVTINPKNIYLVDLYAKSKVYDKNNQIEIMGGRLIGVCDADKNNISFEIVESIVEDCKVGTEKEIHYNAILSGNGKENYNLNILPLQASIFKPPHTGSIVTLSILLGSIIILVVSAVILYLKQKSTQRSHVNNFLYSLDIDVNQYNFEKEKWVSSDITYLIEIIRQNLKPISPPKKNMDWQSIFNSFYKNIYSQLIVLFDDLYELAKEDGNYLFLEKNFENINNMIILAKSNIEENLVNINLFNLNKYFYSYIFYVCKFKNIFLDWEFVYGNYRYETNFDLMQIKINTMKDSLERKEG